MNGIINRARVREICHEAGRQAGDEYLDQLEYRVAATVRAHCRSTGRKRLEAALVGNGPVQVLILAVLCALVWAALLLSPPAWSGEMVRITHYCSCRACTGAGRGLTFTGTRARAGIAAVARDPGKRIFPLGSRILVPGCGELSIEDVGGSVGELELDVFCSTHEEAIQRGVRWIDFAEIQPGGKTE